MNAPRRFEGNGFAELAVAELIDALRAGQSSMLACAPERSRGGQQVVDRVAALGEAGSQETGMLFHSSSADGRNPQMATVFLGMRQFDADGVGGRIGNFVAHVEGGSGGGSFAFDIDYGMGTQFSVPAADVSVSVTMPAIPTSDLTEFANGILTGGIAWGSRAGSSSGCVRTLGPITAAAGGTVILPAPAFAFAFNVHSANQNFYGAGAGPIEIFGSDAPVGGLLATLDSSLAFDALASEGIKLGGFGRAVRITNNLGVAVRFTVPFLLNL